MNPDLLHDVLRELAEFEFKPADDWLRKGVCPACHKKELYAKAQAPWVIRCGRLNHCGYEEHVKDLYPHLFEDWSRRAAPRLALNPNAAADDYLAHARGFDLARLEGWYRQESHFDPKADHGRGAASATVRFPVADGHWERLIDRPQRFGKKKALFRFGMTYHGRWWCPPPVEPATLPALWLVEGIFDAIALHHHGIAAVALLSCNNYPTTALQDLRSALTQAGRWGALELVWALDSDKAGRDFTLKWVAQARAEGWPCAAAQIPQPGRRKVDWNDLHLRDRLGAEHLPEYRHQGALLIAASAAEKALLMYRHAGGQRAEFDLSFHKRLYWFKLDPEAFDRALQALRADDTRGLDEEQLREEALRKSHAIRRIANCLPTPLYYQRNALTDESWYYFRVEFPHDAPAVKNTFTSAHLSAASDFKKRLLHLAPGAVYTGNSQMLERMMERQLYNIQRVETVDFIGYSREHGAYVLGDCAVQAGRVHALNAEDYFELGRLSLKSLNQSVHLSINPDLADYREDWLGLLWTCFGAKGLAALAFWLGALFAEQIRATQKSYPFLEVVGEAGAGKSTLIEFLWKLLGRRDYEGFDPSKSSLAARARNFAQVANLPVVLIESDRERMSSEKGPHARAFDWDELKTAFNGRSVRARGMATGGNETYEPPFRGAIVISQNSEVSASDPILQRIVHLHFDRAAQTPQSRVAAQTLENLPLEAVSGFILRAAQREAQVLDTLAQATARHEAALLAHPQIKSTRVAKNHAQLLALADALRLVVALSDEQHQALAAQLTAMALERQQAINSDHPLVAEFWEIFDFLDGGDCPLNHSRKDDEIAVNLNHFIQAARERGQQVPAIGDLKKVLRTSRRQRFLDVRNVNSGIRVQLEHQRHFKSTAVWCWVFERAPVRQARAAQAAHAAHAAGTSISTGP